MKFRPLHDRVIVKRSDPEEKSAGGISSRTPPRTRGGVRPSAPVRGMFC